MRRHHLRICLNIANLFPKANALVPQTNTVAALGVVLEAGRLGQRRALPPLPDQLIPADGQLVASSQLLLLGAWK